MILSPEFSNWVEIHVYVIIYTTAMNIHPQYMLKEAALICKSSWGSQQIYAHIDSRWKVVIYLCHCTEFIAIKSQSHLDLELKENYTMWVFCRCQSQLHIQFCKTLEESTKEGHYLWPNIEKRNAKFDRIKKILCHVVQVCIIKLTICL